MREPEQVENKWKRGRGNAVWRRDKYVPRSKEAGCVLVVSRWVQEQQGGLGKTNKRQNFREGTVWSRRCAGQGNGGVDARIFATPHAQHQHGGLRWGAVRCGVPRTVRNTRKTTEKLQRGRQWYLEKAKDVVRVSASQCYKIAI